METETVTPEAVEETEREGSTALAQAEALEIVSMEGCDVAGEMLKTVAGYRKRVVATFKPMKKKAKDAHTEICDTEKRLLDPAKRAEALLKNKIGAYHDEQERLARIEAEKARQEAEAEARRQAEEEQRLAAEAAAEAGNEEEFDRIIEQEPQPMPVAPPVPEPTVPKTAGVVHSKVWDYEVIDPKLIPRDYLTIDTKKIAKVVKAMKEDTKIPGVRAFQKRQIATRS